MSLSRVELKVKFTKPTQIDKASTVTKDNGKDKHKKLANFKTEKASA